MKCEEFKNYVMEYVEEELSPSLDSDIKEHLKECSDCRKFFDIRKKARMDIQKVLDSSNSSFKSRRTAVISSINKDRYAMGPLGKLKYSILRNKSVYSVCAALLVSIIILGPMLFHEIERSRNTSPIGVANSQIVTEGFSLGTEDNNAAKIVEENLSAIVNNKASNVAVSSNPYRYIEANQDKYNEIIKLGRPALKYMLSQFASTKENGLKEYIMAAACSDILKEKEEDKKWATAREWYELYLSSTNPTGDGVSLSTGVLDRKLVVNALMEIKNMPYGVGPWITVYSSDDRVIFYNYRHLMVYDNRIDNKGIYRILDFQPLDVGFYQGSSVVKFIISPDGNKCIIGNMGDGSYEAKSLYMYDIEENKVSKIAEKIEMNSANSGWSEDSRYFVYEKGTGEERFIFDSQALKIVGSDVEVKVYSEDNKYPRVVEQLMSVCKVAVDENTEVDINTEFAAYWNIKNSNTIIGVADRPDDNMTLGDFQVVEIDIKTKESKVVFIP